MGGRVGIPDHGAGNSDGREGISVMRRKDEMDNLVAKKSPPRGAGEGGKSTSTASKALIARNLRLAFGEVAAEPIPKEWLDLLEKIDEPKGGQ